MKKMFTKMFDEVLEMILGSFDIDLCELKDEDLITGATPL